MTSSDHPPRLYKGEIQATAAGHPVLTKYIPGDGDRSKPPVAFVPGIAHNARISYGGHHGSRSEDFLGHWFPRRGHAFLGISYPLESHPEIMPAHSSDFSLRDWGRQVAEVIKTTVDEHNLAPSVIVLAWSMAGKIVEPVAAAAQALDLDICLFVALAGSPALLGIGPPSLQRVPRCTDAGYLSGSAMHESFLSQLADQGRQNGHTIIDPAVYCREFVGAIPAPMTGFGYHWNSEQKTLVQDNKWMLLEDGCAHHFGSLPPMAAIAPSGTLDLRHALSDKATWGYLMTHRALTHIQGRPGVQDLGAADDAWSRLKALVHSLPDRLATSVEGNHFFFVGEKGARETVDAVLGLLQESRAIGAEFEAVLGGLVSQPNS